MLDRQFKNNNSNFKIAIVVDMWITGFDVPSLAVMYIDKPLQKHTLIQTISRVNRVFDGKDMGLVVDYIGIKQDMLEAVKKAKEQQDKQAELAMKKMKEAREKAEKDIADRLAAEEAALQKEIEESKQNVANAQKETNQDIADMYKSFGYEVPEEYLSSGKTK